MAQFAIKRRRKRMRKPGRIAPPSLKYVKALNDYMVIRVSAGVFNVLCKVGRTLPDPFHVTPDYVLRHIFGLPQKWEEEKAKAAGTDPATITPVKEGTS